MARMARVVAPGYPHHVTQRGVRRMQTFYSDDDYQTYIRFVAEGCTKAGTEVWAYCLMPNHIHLILVPQTEDGLRAALGEAHRRYTQFINFREECRGHLWQDRFSSFPMDEKYLIACARYVELNPVRAGLVAKPDDWRWSSARAHLADQSDGLLKARPMLDLIPDWAIFLAGGVQDAELKRLRTHNNTGRPCGAEAWITQLEQETGRIFRRKKPGPKKFAGSEPTAAASGPSCS